MIKIQTNMGFQVTLPDDAGECAVEILKMNYQHEKMMLIQRHEKEMAELKAEHGALYDYLVKIDAVDPEEAEE